MLDKNCTLGPGGLDLVQLKTRHCIANAGCVLLTGQRTHKDARLAVQSVAYYEPVRSAEMMLCTVTTYSIYGVSKAPGSTPMVIFW